LLAVANGAPVIARRLLGEKAASPFDFDRKFFDGLPIFGPSKTIEGIAAALVATACVAPALGLSWWVGAITAIACMAGDLFSSFVKRRLGMRSSSQAIGLDQIPEALFGALAVRPALPLTLTDVAVVTFAFLIGQMILSRISFAVGLRKHPF
jgi:CDP-2,3-bis-(O-geranylgeranyl)-sn-glycerol synthase